MDWAVITAVALVAAYLGYLIGLFVHRGWLRRGGGGGEDPGPIEPTVGPDDFQRWEHELAGLQMT